MVIKAAPHPKEHRVKRENQKDPASFPRPEMAKTHQNHF